MIPRGAAVGDPVVAGKRDGVGQGRFGSEVNSSGLAEGGDDLIPPPVIKFSKARDDLGVGGGAEGGSKI